MKTGMEFWVSHVAAAKLEGTSASAYAKHHGIAVSALYYWQRKLRSPTGGRAVAGQAGRFVALRVAEALIAPRPCGCSLVPVCSSGQRRLDRSDRPAEQRCIRDVVRTGMRQAHGGLARRNSCNYLI